MIAVAPELLGRRERPVLLQEPLDQGQGLRVRLGHRASPSARPPGEPDSPEPCHERYRRHEPALGDAARRLSATLSGARASSRRRSRGARARPRRRNGRRRRAGPKASASAIAVLVRVSAGEDDRSPARSRPARRSANLPAATVPGGRRAWSRSRARSTDVADRPGRRRARPGFERIDAATSSCSAARSTSTRSRSPRSASAARVGAAAISPARRVSASRVVGASPST